MYVQTNARQEHFALIQKKCLARHQEIKADRIKVYNENPKICFHCSQPISYDKQINKFCSRSCAATSNQTGGKRSTETKERISVALKAIERARSQSKPSQKVCKIQFKTCASCGMVFYTRGKGQWGRKTCSRPCQILASTSRTYQNGSRKDTQFLNKNTGEYVRLESSWEVAVAQKLDDAGVIWMRPAPIIWSDHDLPRLYYPDFYLPDHNLYLDPKNPHCMKLDVEKMRSVSDLIDIRYGSLPYILSEIDVLVGVQSTAL